MALAQCVAMAVARPGSHSGPQCQQPLALHGSGQSARRAACSPPGVGGSGAEVGHVGEGLAPEAAPGNRRGRLPSLPLGDRPENILKKSPLHAHCFQAGFKTELIKSGSQSRRALSQLPGHSGAPLAPRGCLDSSLCVPGASSLPSFPHPEKKKKKVRHFPGRAAGGATHPHFLESRTSIT